MTSPRTQWLRLVRSVCTQHDPGSGEFAGSWPPLPATPPAWPVWTPSPDSTLSNYKVFLAAWGSAAVSDAVGLILASHWWDITGGEAPPLLAAIGIPILGTAAGATLAGSRFQPALAGSALGLGAALVTFAVSGPIVDPNDSFVLLIAIPAAVQAAVTTLIVSNFN